MHSLKDGLSSGVDGFSLTGPSQKLKKKNIKKNNNNKKQTNRGKVY